MDNTGLLPLPLPLRLRLRSSYRESGVLLPLRDGFAAPTGQQGGLYAPLPAPALSVSAYGLHYEGAARQPPQSGGLPKPKQQLFFF